jgi:putative iron-regulated protein
VVLLATTKPVNAGKRCAIFLPTHLTSRKQLTGKSMTGRSCIIVTITALSLCCLPAATADAAPGAVLNTYADIALAGYQDSPTTAKALYKAVKALIANPGTKTLDAARAAWKAARIPYQQTEVFRFGNAIVDDWEGKVNAWPLEEGLIDYVDASYGTGSDGNPLYTANVIASISLTINGKTVDTSKITPELLADVPQEAAMSRPMSPPAITPSNFCSGGRI